jgi:BirA family transcriptional regulator, biotin operon repressor / biotin---[acetyl-CoA-carboxylase] ligase
MTPHGALAALNGAAEALWQAVAPRLPAFSVEVLPSIDSTNTELMRRARAGTTEPVLLVALEQTAGRGRRGRPWVSAPGDSLTFSLGLPLHPADWSGLSLAVGLSLAERMPPEVRLKWPNDLWWHDRKLGGILVETASVGDRRYAVIGVGLNVRTPVLPAPDGLPNLDPALPPPVPPAGLDETAPPETPQGAGHWLARLVPALIDDLLAFETNGFGPLAARFTARDALAGRWVRLSDGQEGRATGVAPDGALLLDTPLGRLRITQQEVSVRPC